MSPKAQDGNGNFAARLMGAIRLYNRPRQLPSVPAVDISDLSGYYGKSSHHVNPSIASRKNMSQNVTPPVAVTAMGETGMNTEEEQKRDAELTYDLVKKYLSGKEGMIAKRQCQRRTISLKDNRWVSYKLPPMPLFSK